MPPIRFGIKNTALKKLVPPMPFVSAKANKNAKRLTEITATMVNFMVNHNAFIKLVSSVKAAI